MAVVGRRYAISGEGYSTEGQITHVGGEPDVPLDALMLPMALCADAEVQDGALVGDPTEGALVVLAAKGGVEPTLTRERYPRVATLPFDAAYKFMATFHRMRTTRQGGRARLRQGRPGPAPRAATAAQGPEAPATRSTRCASRTWPRTTAWRPGPAGPGHRPSATSTRRRSTRRPTSAAGRASSSCSRSSASSIRRGPRPAMRSARPRGRHPGPHDHRRPRRHRRGDDPDLMPADFAFRDGVRASARGGSTMPTVPGAPGRR